MSNSPDDQKTNPQVGSRNEPSGLTNEQLAGLFGPTPKREVPYLLTLEGRPALGAVAVALALAWYFLFGR